MEITRYSYAHGSYSSLGVCSRAYYSEDTHNVTPVNGPAVGTVRGYGGPRMLMLSAVDGPPGPSVAAVHGPGDHP